MRLTRRTLAAAALLPLVAATGARAAARPMVIAHRGASGERPEHTLAAYRLAIAQGADVIEPDLVPTRDGHLVARHENEISGTTDVAARPEFASRRGSRRIDGEMVEGWFTEDFTLAELKTLRARERLPRLRPASAAYDGQESIPTFQEVVDLARTEGARRGRAVGLAPEMKHPAYFAALGLDLEPRLARALAANGLDAADAPVAVQCFEVSPLKRFRTLSRAPAVQLVSAESGPADDPGTTYARMVTPAGLSEIAAYAQAVGAEWPLVLPVRDGRIGVASPLVGQAHAAGLKVYAWTHRVENAFLPESLRRGDDPAARGDSGTLLRALYAAGVDGVFSDYPGMAAEVRART